MKFKLISEPLDDENRDYEVTVNDEGRVHFLTLLEALTFIFN